jgi:hypothetical protein
MGPQSSSEFLGEQKRKMLSNGIVTAQLNRASPSWFFVSEPLDHPSCPKE